MLKTVIAIILGSSASVSWFISAWKSNAKATLGPRCRKGIDRNHNHRLASTAYQAKGGQSLGEDASMLLFLF
jgi:hypothetical protein